MKVKNAIDLLTNYVKSLPDGEIRQAIRLVIRETKNFQTVKTEMKSEKFMELEYACGYWIGWVNGVFVAIHQDLKTLLKTLKRYSK